MREKGNRKFRIQDQKYANMEEIKPKKTLQFCSQKNECRRKSEKKEMERRKTGVLCTPYTPQRLVCLSVTSVPKL
jgi:hypothetical protein